MFESGVNIEKSRNSLCNSFCTVAKAYRDLQA